MRVPFRAQLALMALDRYTYGDHVSDPRAFRMRVESFQRFNAPILLREGGE